METVVLAVVLVLVLFAAMAVGIMFGRPPIKGSCGGMSSAMGDKDCPICGGDKSKCEENGRDGPRGDGSVDSERELVFEEAVDAAVVRDDQDRVRRLGGTGRQGTHRMLVLRTIKAPPVSKAESNSR